MVTATPMLICSSVASQLYNITVTCTIHPDSIADQCVVMAMADDGVTRTGEICNHCFYKIVDTTEAYVHTYIVKIIHCHIVHHYIAICGIIFRHCCYH